MRTSIRWSALLGASIFAFACGSNSSGGFNGGGPDDTGDAGTASSGGGSNGGGASGSSSSGTGTSSSFSTSGAQGMGNGTCKTGEYAGTFSCYFYMVFDAGLNYVADSGGVGPVMGTLSFALTQDISSVGEGTGTDTAMGNFNANTGGIIAADANLMGTLECGQGSFTGNLINGVYGLPNGDAAPISFGGTSNTFMGPLVSDYNGTMAEFVNGRWSMTIPTLGECIGSWSASYSGAADAGEQ